jgi:hypothetical protein
MYGEPATTGIGVYLHGEALFRRAPRENASNHAQVAAEGERTSASGQRRV